MSLSRARVATVHIGKVIRVSERVIRPMKEPLVRQIMTKVEGDVKGWPGLLSMETLVDTHDENRFVVITEWESRSHLKFWLKSDLCKKLRDDLDKVLEEPVSYRELMHHEDDVFLL